MAFFVVQRPDMFSCSDHPCVFSRRMCHLCDNFYGFNLCPNVSPTNYLHPPCVFKSMCSICARFLCTSLEVCCISGILIASCTLSDMFAGSTYFLVLTSACHLINEFPLSLIASQNYKPCQLVCIWVIHSALSIFLCQTL